LLNFSLITSILQDLAQLNNLHRHSYDCANSPEHSTGSAMAAIVMQAYSLPR